MLRPKENRGKSVRKWPFTEFRGVKWPWKPRRGTISSNKPPEQALGKASIKSFKCEICPYSGPEEVCPTCKTSNLEVLKDGATLKRVKAPSYITEDIDKTIQENNQLVEQFLQMSENRVRVDKAMQENLEKRGHLHQKMKTIVDHGIHKGKLHKEDRRWQYDFVRKEFIGFKSPQTKPAEYREGKE
jgi:hypothetical protein